MILDPVGDALDGRAAPGVRVERGRATAEARFANYVQPAFAARSLDLSPLDLDARRMPQGVVVAGVAFLVVPVEPAALARARFLPTRLRDLVLRFAPDGVVALAEGEATLDARLFARAGEAPFTATAALAVAAFVGRPTGTLHGFDLGEGPSVGRAPA